MSQASEVVRASMPSTNKRISHEDMLQLKRWNTPTIYNGWEQITSHDPAADAFNLEECHDFMPHMGPMVGRAVTVVIEPSNRSHAEANPNAWHQYREYLASISGPKIVVVQDLDKPKVIGAFWGEVNSNVHRAFGCVGSIVDGGIRDLDEMFNSGFKALARRLCVGHAHVFPVRWNCPVTVFGRQVHPGQLIHADKHGFMAIPPEDEGRLLPAATYMDRLECTTLIPATRSGCGSSFDLIDKLDKAGAKMSKLAKEEFGKTGEWK